MENRNRIIPYRSVIACFLCAIVVAFAYTAEQSFAAASIEKAKVKVVNAKVVANKTVQVSWKKISVADGYTVYYSTKKNGKYKKGKTVAKKQSSARIAKLAQGKTYYFKVRPYAKKGALKKYGAESKAVKCIVRPAAPKVKSLTVSTTERKVTFTRVAGVSGYEVWRATKKPGKKATKYKKLKTLSAKTRVMTDKKLSATMNYYYKVRAFAKNGKTRVYGSYSAVSTIVSGGNAAKYDPGKVAFDKNSGLKGRKILFLGSSITYGSGTVPKGISFVDYLKKKDGVDVVAKEAVSGTTISFAEDDNYCVRLEKYKRDPGTELLVCQLSSNDARRAAISDPIDPISDVNPESDNYVDDGDVPVDQGEEIDGDGDIIVDDDPGYDDEAILSELRANAENKDGDYRYVDDAIKYIIAYSNLELGVPVMFYIIPPFKNTKKFNADFYKKMRGCLLDIVDPENGWINGEHNIYGRDFQVEVLDLWVDRSFSTFTTYDQARAFYMRDSVHPTKAGYYHKYLPKFETKLRNILK